MVPVAVGLGEFLVFKLFRRGVTRRVGSLDFTLLVYTVEFSNVTGTLDCLGDGPYIISMWTGTLSWCVEFVVVCFGK